MGYLTLSQRVSNTCAIVIDVIIDRFLSSQQMWMTDDLDSLMTDFKGKLNYMT